MKSRFHSQPDQRQLGEDLVHLIPCLLAARWLQIPHRRFHVGVTQPLLNGAKVNSSPKAFRGERRSEFVQPEIIRVELRTFCYGLETIQEIQLRSASPGWEQQIAVPARLRLPCLETLCELRGNRNLPLLVGLRRPSPIRLVTDADGGRSEVHIPPVRMHHLLLSHPSHQKELVP